jgi:hypothetical protein
MQGRPLPEQVADEVVQARDRRLVGDPIGDPLVVLDLGVDFFALLAHVPTTRPPADRFLSQREAFPRRAVCDRAERNHRAPGALPDPPAAELR